MAVLLLPPGRFDVLLEAALHEAADLAERLGHPLIEPAHLLYGLCARHYLPRLFLAAGRPRVAQAVETALGGRGSGRPTSLSDELRRFLELPTRCRRPTAEGLLNAFLRPGAWEDVPGGARLAEAVGDLCPDLDRLRRALDEAPVSAEGRRRGVDTAEWSGSLDHFAGCLLTLAAPSFLERLRQGGLDPDALARRLLGLPSTRTDEAALVRAVRRAWEQEEERAPAPLCSLCVMRRLPAAEGDTVRRTLEELGFTLFRARPVGGAKEGVLLREAAAQEAQRQRVPRVEAHHLIMGVLAFRSAGLRQCLLEAGVPASRLIPAWQAAFPRRGGPDEAPQWGASAENALERAARAAGVPPEGVFCERVLLTLLEDPTEAGAFLREAAGSRLDRLARSLGELVEWYEEEDDDDPRGRLDLRVHLEVDGLPLGVGPATVEREHGAADLRLPRLAGERWLWLDQRRRVDLRREEEGLVVSSVRGTSLQAGGEAVLDPGSCCWDAWEFLGQDLEKRGPGHRVKAQLAASTLRWVELAST